jgi:ATP-dependent helicase HrpA
MPEQSLPAFADCLLSDAATLNQWQKQLHSRLSRALPCDKLQQQCDALQTASRAQVQARRAWAQAIEFPETLPICGKREEIAACIALHPVVVLAGETGSGKTTQLPKICLTLGLGCRGMIGHTQPRRLAARTVANRIAEELQSPLGSRVGYQVRFNEQCQANTQIKLMTDGILLAEIQQDPLLLRYDCLIIDEAHERSLNIDFILGYLKQILPKRPDLKIIITSATIDLERFSRHFDGAPIIEVSGRTFPVDVWYRPLHPEQDLPNGIMEAVEEILHLPKKAGDILVFLSGEREIRDLAKQLRQLAYPGLDVLPLYARLSQSEQNRVFQPTGGRRIVLATNVAETSITVPGIGYVIDPGTARISRYSHKSKLQRLPIEAISQASANQRKGRCGRVSSGICIRLYDETDFNNRPAFTDAEILRTNLAAVILQMLNVGVGDIRKFPFVDPPDSRLISDGFKLLEALKAVTPQGTLTATGKKLARLPIDPRLASMLMEAHRQHALTEVLIICTALSIQDPRERPPEKQQAADEKHRRYWHPDSDFLAYVALWNDLEADRQELTGNQFKKRCEKDFLSYLRIKEWRELHHQLRLACKEAGFKENAEPASYEAVHKSLLVGLLDNIGQKNDEPQDHDYLGARHRKFSIFPGSSQFKKKPKWVLVAQLLETSKVYGHTAAKIEPEWIIASADHLLKHHYYQPFYAHQTGQVLGYDRITLYGLVLNDKQRINYAQIDPVVARDIFIRQALLEGGYARHPKPAIGEFYLHNQKMLAQVQELEAKSRRKDIVVEDQVIYDFYAERLPEQIANRVAFETWRKTAEAKDKTFLFIPQSHLMRHQADAITEAQFPKNLRIDTVDLSLAYHFEPGSANDGVSIQVPINILHTLPQAPLDWLVPGLLKEKCAAILKCLPKHWRKRFVPIPNTLEKIMPRLAPGKKTLLESLTDELQRIVGEKLPADLWNDLQLDAFYHMNIQVLDERNKLIAQSRDLTELKANYRANVQESLQAVSEHLEQTGLTRWSFARLDEETRLKRGALTIRAYPALLDQQNHVDLKMLDNPQEALALSAKGLSRLALLQMNDAVKYLHKLCFKTKSLLLTQVQLGTQAQVVDDLLLASVWQCCFAERPITRDLAAFNEALSARNGLIPTALAYETVLIEAFTQVLALRQQLKAVKNPLPLVETHRQVQQQLDAFFYPGFIFQTPWLQVQQLPRYLKAIASRWEKAQQSPAKDQALHKTCAIFWQRHQDRLAKLGPLAYRLDPQWQEFRWLIEELRVSLFAQQLKTRVPVSEQRLEKAWQALSLQRPS